MATQTKTPTAQPRKVKVIPYDPAQDPATMAYAARQKSTPTKNSAVRNARMMPTYTSMGDDRLKIIKE